MAGSESNDIATASDRQADPGSGPEVPAKPATRPIMDALRLAIANRRISINAISRAAGVDAQNIRRFVNHRSDLKVATADKLFNVLGLEVLPAKAKMISRKKVPRKSATNQEASIGRTASISQAIPPARVEPDRACPVNLRGEGLPIRVYGREVPPLTGIAYELTAFAVERFHQGGECFGTELGDRTGTKRPIRILMRKLDLPRFGPLARVLIWDARKGGTLRIIDPGPQVDRSP